MNPRAKNGTLRVILYFAFARDEYLTNADMRARFDFLRHDRSISPYLKGCVRHGLLRTWKEPDVGLVWGAGPELLKMVDGMVL